MTRARSTSRILDEVHETAQDFHAAGFIDARRMRTFDALCLGPIAEWPPERIRELRSRHQLSQVVFASVLNTSASTVRQWEIGAKRPSGPSHKLLHRLDRYGRDVVLSPPCRGPALA